MSRPRRAPWRVAALLAVLAAVAVAVRLATVDRAREPGVRAGLSLAETLGDGDTAGFARAEEAVELAFPLDHGPHPDFRNEWWYATGNLWTPEGRRFGYQLTFFRTALRAADDVEPAAGPEPSRWRTRQAWMAHFTLTDAGAGRFHAFERFEREALGLAGARLDPFRVHVGGWEMAGGDGVFPLRLAADGGPAALDLVLDPAREPVLQGQEGLSRKGPGPGQASYYYSLPRLETRGTVRTPEGSFEVTGSSWIDREWSTSVLPDGVVGWDWFALQLADGRDVMVYSLRRADGTPSPFSAGMVAGQPDGAGMGPVARLVREDFTVEVLDRWTSPVDGADYPSRWRIRIPRAGLDLDVRPVLDGQELDLAFRYWEGAVDVFPWGGAGGEAGRTGWGYVELTGYAGGGRPSR